MNNQSAIMLRPIERWKNMNDGFKLCTELVFCIVWV